MAEVKLSGQALLQEIAETRPAEGSLAFWWMGQASYIYKGSAVLYFDPFFAPSSARQTAPMLGFEEATNADLVLCSHDHSDHIDPPSLRGIAKASPDAIFVVPHAHREKLVNLGIAAERVVGLDHMEDYRHDGVKITAIKAKHEFFYEDPELGFPYLGYVIEMNGFRFYHSGDTIPYEGLIPSLVAHEPHAVFLPINGRDAARYRSGCIGNMTFQEAVDVAGEVGVKWAVPMHWDMFKGNQEDPQKFVDYMNAKFPEIQTWVGSAGERVTLDR